SAEPLAVTDVVLTETAYVLTSVYHVPRNVVVDHLIQFLQKENVSPHGLDKSFVLQAFLLCRPSGRVSFGDAMIWAAARSSGATVVYSFDERSVFSNPISRYRQIDRGVVLWTLPMQTTHGPTGRSQVVWSLFAYWPN
ncbi:MAG: PIN domain-containing protein, partial [Chloroflexi bacterium]|nr:PIN domain-containing protein [Chloroflexota bacterium]